MTKKKKIKFEHNCAACKYLRMAFLRFIYSPITNIYIFIFARPSAQSINNILLQLALRGSGYNNCCDMKTSGEAIFIDLLAKTNPKLCIDIGANRGEYSQTLLLKTNAQIIAFEPLPKAFEDLTKLEIQHPNRFKAVNLGLGLKEGNLELYYGDEDSRLASFCKEVEQIGYVGEHNTNVMTVPVTTLDTYYQKYLKDNFHNLDLLKIDTEGFEYEVLLGAQQMIDELKPNFIQIEYNWHQLFRNQSLKALSELMPDYLAYQVLPYGSGLVKRDLNRPESNIYQYSNFIFIRNGITLKK